MRLNNYISATGLCSRRQADDLIRQNKVKINGKPAVLGCVVGPEDIVEVDGKILASQKNQIYIALNKPVGIVCTTERHIKGNIIDYINHRERIFPIGRLDKDSEGLILLTNDGSIVNEVLAEENGHEKEYIVTVDKPIKASFLEGMSKGVKIYNPVKNEYTITKPCRVIKINDKCFRIILCQGLNRQIRRMCAFYDYKVMKLQRIRIMNITLSGLTAGRWRNLTEEEVKHLRPSKK